MDSCIVNKLMVFSSPGSALISQHTPLRQRVFGMLKLNVSCVFNFKKMFEEELMGVLWYEGVTSSSQGTQRCLCFGAWFSGIIVYQGSPGICLQGRYSSSIGKHTCLLQHCGNQAC